MIPSTQTKPAATYPQGSLLFPREAFAFRGQSGRITRAFPGQSFWVTNPEYIQASSGVVSVARSGRNSGAAEAFTADDVARYFKAI